MEKIKIGTFLNKQDIEAIDAIYSEHSFSSGIADSGLESNGDTFRSVHGNCAGHELSDEEVDTLLSDFGFDPKEFHDR